MKQILKNKKILLISGLAVMALLVGGFLVARNRNNQSADKSDGLTEIKYEAATEEEKRETEAHKKEVARRADQENNPSSPPTTGRTVAPVITSSGQDPYSRVLEVGAFIPNVYEDNGLCILNLTRGTSVVTETKTAIKNVSDTTCGIITVDSSRLAPGDWRAEVSYKSNTASGTSSAINISVE